jgi:hypothetical protein
MSEPQAEKKVVRYRPTNTELEIRDYVKMVAPAEIIPERWRGNVRAVYACVKAGEEIGLAPQVALRYMYLVKGRFGLMAEAMNALARSHNHSITGSASSTKAVAKGKRGDNGDEMTVEFTLEDAQRAGLDGANWKHYPDDMLWARAVSKLCRRLFPDVFGGLAYTVEELQNIDDADYEELEPVDLSEPVMDLGNNKSHTAEESQGTKASQKGEEHQPAGASQTAGEHHFVEASQQPREHQTSEAKPLKVEEVADAEPELEDRQATFGAMAEDAIKRKQRRGRSGDEDA